MSKDPDRTSTPAESGMGTAARMGQVVPFAKRDRPVAVGVDSGNVVYLDTRMFDRWDSAVSGVGGSEGVTDAQLHDVFLLMVAEMSGMVASKGGRGENTNEA